MDQEQGRAGLSGGPAISPLQQRHHDGKQFTACLGQTVLEAFRVFLVPVPLHDPCLHKGRQALRENVPGDAEAPLKLLEAGQSEERVPQDEGRPPLPDDLECPGDRAVHLGETGSLHPSRLPLRCMMQLHRLSLRPTSPGGGNFELLHMRFHVGAQAQPSYFLGTEVKRPHPGSPLES